MSETGRIRNRENMKNDMSNNVKMAPAMEYKDYVIDLPPAVNCTT